MLATVKFHECMHDLWHWCKVPHYSFIVNEGYLHGIVASVSCIFFARTSQIPSAPPDLYNSIYQTSGNVQIFVVTQPHKTT